MSQWLIILVISYWHLRIFFSHWHLNKRKHRLQSCYLEITNTLKSYIKKKKKLMVNKQLSNFWKAIEWKVDIGASLCCHCGIFFKFPFAFALIFKHTCDWQGFHFCTLAQMYIKSKVSWQTMVVIYFQSKSLPDLNHSRFFSTLNKIS